MINRWSSRPKYKTLLIFSPEFKGISVQGRYQWHPGGFGGTSSPFFFFTTDFLLLFKISLSYLSAQKKSILDTTVYEKHSRKRQVCQNQRTTISFAEAPTIEFTFKFHLVRETDLTVNNPLEFQHGLQPSACVQETTRRRALFFLNKRKVQNQGDF